jgi:hypothetical protein
MPGYEKPPQENGRATLGLLVPTAGSGALGDVARPGVEFSEKEKTLPVQG